MRDAGVIGIARVVVHTKEHLAALIPSGPALMLNTIRWAGDIRPASELKLPPDGKAAAKLKPGELTMAAHLIAEMTAAFKPDDYTDNFTAAVHALVNQKLDAGETERATPIDAEAADARSSNVVDLTELLTRSLARRKPAGAAAKPAAPKRAAAKRARAAIKPARLLRPELAPVPTAVLSPTISSRSVGIAGCCCHGSLWRASSAD